LSILLMGDDALGYLLLGVLKAFSKNLEIEAWILADSNLSKRIAAKGFILNLSGDKHHISFDGTLSSFFEMTGEEFDIILISDFFKKTMERLSRLIELDIKARELVVASKVLFPIASINKLLAKKLPTRLIIFDGFTYWIGNEVRKTAGDTIYLQKKFDGLFPNILKEPAEMAGIKVRIQPDFENIYWALMMNKLIVGMLSLLNIKPSDIIDSKNARDIYNSLLEDLEKVLRIEGISLASLRLTVFHYLPRLRYLRDDALESLREWIFKDISYLSAIIGERVKTKNITLKALPTILKIMLALKDVSHTRD